MDQHEVNGCIQWAKTVMRGAGHLPPWAYWTLKEWGANKDRVQETIIQWKLGWDVTPFGGTFAETGLIAFTLCNWEFYCQKFLLMRRGQRIPTHAHVKKREDISVQEGKVVFRLFNVAPDGNTLLETPVTCLINQMWQTIPAGSELILSPGESIRLTPGIAHEIASGDCEYCLMVEVSTVNDDDGDNIFFPSLPRYVAFVRNTTPVHLCCSQYAEYLGHH